MRTFLAAPFLVIGKACAFIVELITGKMCVFESIADCIEDGIMTEVNILAEDAEDFQKEIDAITDPDPDVFDKVIEKYEQRAREKRK